jgi:hypothetical protein
MRTSYKICLRDRDFVPNICMSLQTTLSAEARLAGQFLLEEQILNIEKSLIYQAVTWRPTVSKEKGHNLEPQ